MSITFWLTTMKMSHFSLFTILINHYTANHYTNQPLYRQPLYQSTTIPPTTILINHDTANHYTNQPRYCQPLCQSTTILSTTISSTTIPPTIIPYAFSGSHGVWYSGVLLYYMICCTVLWCTLVYVQILIMIKNQLCFLTLTPSHFYHEASNTAIINQYINTLAWPFCKDIHVCINWDIKPHVK